MRQTWTILLFAFVLMGALIGFTDVATEISYMGRILFYTASVLFVLNLTWRTARRRSRQRRQ